MTVTIEITTGNEAFTDNEGREVARILIDLAKRIDGDQLAGLDRILWDINGNRVGTAKAKD